MLTFNFTSQKLAATYQHEVAWRPSQMNSKQEWSRPWSKQHAEKQVTDKLGDVADWLLYWWCFEPFDSDSK